VGANPLHMGNSVSNQQLFGMTPLTTGRDFTQTYYSWFDTTWWNFGPICSMA